MNIFILSNDPVEAAIYQCDKHVRKMLIETAQLLSTAHRFLDGVSYSVHATYNVYTDNWKLFLKNYKIVSKEVHVLDDEEVVNDVFDGESVKVLKSSVYLSTHVNHPCNVWARENSANYVWLYRHFVALCSEYTCRFNKEHQTGLMINSLSRFPRNIKFSNEMTPFALGMKDYPELMTDDSVESYRAFYQTKQDRMQMTWTNSIKPKWFKERVAT